MTKEEEAKPAVTLPEVLEKALEARTALDVCDRRLHPRIHTRLAQTYLDARANLKAEYPELEEWLFGYPYSSHLERLVELRRLGGQL